MIAAFFPGQGAQHVGMGKTFFDDFSSVRIRFEEASDILKFNLKKLCFDGPESELTLTENAQPALLTLSFAIFEAFQKECGFKPKVVAGHSLGEYSALVAAQALAFPTAVRLVRERGIAMQKAVPAGEGTMAAVMGLDDATVIRLCEIAQKKNGGVVEAANFNSPGQVVIAGTTSGVQNAIETLKTDPTFKGGKAIPLSVSAPFHSSLMRPARERMETLFKDLPPSERPQTLTCPYVPNRTARLTTEAGVVLTLLAEQIDHTVLWRQTVEELLSRDCRIAKEFGPGKVLQGLCRRIKKDEKIMEVASINDLETFKMETTKI